MSSQPDVRLAGPADADALAALRWDFRADLHPPAEDRGRFLVRCAAWMRHALGPDGAWRAWVALAGGRPIGAVWLQVLEKVPNPVGERDRHGYLSNLYVAPAARGGVGTQLLEAALAWAAEQGVDRIVLWPTPRSRSLYRRYGFTGEGDVMELIVRHDAAD